MVAVVNMIVATVMRSLYLILGAMESEKSQCRANTENQP